MNDVIFFKSCVTHALIKGQNLVYLKFINVHELKSEYSSPLPINI